MWPKKKAKAVKASYPTDESVHVRLEQIENGHLSHVSHTNKKGDYQTTTRFHKKPPKHMGSVVRRVMGSRY